MNTIDLFIHDYISTSRTADLTSFLYLVTTIFDFSLYFVLIVLCLMGLIYLVKNKIYSIFFGLVLTNTAVIVYILKYIFNVARPSDSVAIFFGQSFPSYHSAISTTFFILIIYIFRDNLESKFRKILYIFCFLFIFLVSFSRIYLGAHWSSDVLVGVVIGALSAYFSIGFFEHVRNRSYITSMIK